MTTDDKSPPEHSLLGHSVLGQSVDYDADYDPSLLFAIPRLQGRLQLGLDAELPFDGCDIWNAYELSWLHATGKPAVAWAELRIPALSPFIVESKSLKLYLNSLNQTCFEGVEAVAAAIRRDVSACVVADIDVQVRLPTSWSAFPIEVPAGDCLDDLEIAVVDYTPRPDLLRLASAQVVTRRWFSRLLRSLGFSCQRPERRAIERDEPKIEHWKRVEWPAIKKKRAGRSAPSSSSTSLG